MPIPPTATASCSSHPSDPTGRAAPAQSAPDSAATRALHRLIWTWVSWLTQWIYRIRVEGRENLPATGGALLVANHLSLADPFIIGAASGRYVRFLMHERTFRKPLIGIFARWVGVIPISSEQRPRDLIRSLRSAAEAIRQGDLVCIFAEGQVTRIGQMLPFRRGFERIMDGLEAPVIPVCLDGLWGSLFSFTQRKFLWKRPQRLPYPVSVSYGPPRPSNTAPAEVRQVVQELACDAWRHRKSLLQPLGQAFVQSARRHPFRFALGDQRTPRLNFLNALARTIYLARRLRPHWEGQEKVGILLPPSVGGALVNFAAQVMGKVPVNLNYTASTESIAASIRQCEITTIISSQAFLDKVKLDLPFPALKLEEIAGQPRATERLASLAMACLLPMRQLERALGCRRRVEMDDLATVIFSSGSTGDPKGVMLSHFNIAANVAQLAQAFSPTAADGFLGTLPFFHSFGFTGTLALTGTLGLGVAYHPTPLDAEAVGRLVREYELTFLLTTPTFLQLYLRGCPADDFGSLRVVLAGAEKLPERLATAFEERFGIRPLEGYGCTECAPAVSVNIPSFRAAGLCQVGAKRARIGHPLPGVAVRIVDPITRAPVPVGQPGLMLVRGPNVMQGYLGRPDLTAEVLRDGWYTTGDVAALDKDGFVQITDRLSRFSKIGGEMVPHIKVEEKLQELARSLDRILVVTGVGDDKKGERLVVLHCLDEQALQDLLSRLPQLDLARVREVAIRCATTACA